MCKQHTVYMFIMANRIWHQMLNFTQHAYLHKQTNGNSLFDKYKKELCLDRKLFFNFKNIISWDNKCPGDRSIPIFRPLMCSKKIHSFSMKINMTKVVRSRYAASIGSMLTRQGRHINLTIKYWSQRLDLYHEKSKRKTWTKSCCHLFDSTNSTFKREKKK